jgi:hypothetical protein
MQFGGTDQQEHVPSDNDPLLGDGDEDMITFTLEEGQGNEKKPVEMTVDEALMAAGGCGKFNLLCVTIVISNMFVNSL